MANRSAQAFVMHDVTIVPVSGRTSPARLLAWVRAVLAPAKQPESPVEASDRRAADRDAAAAELARARDSEAAELPALALAEEQAHAHLQRLAPAYEQAVQALETARSAHIRRSHDLSYAKTLAERRIEAAAEPVIDEFALRLLDLRAATLQIRIEEDEREGGFDGHSGIMLFEVWSNQPSILARADAIFAAYHAATAMKVDPDQNDIRARLEALLEGLPDAGELVKVYTPPAYEPPPRWPTYEESRAELLGRPLPDAAERRSFLARSGLSRVLGRS